MSIARRRDARVDVGARASSALTRSSRVSPLSRRHRRSRRRGAADRAAAYQSPQPDVDAAGRGVQGAHAVHRAVRIGALLEQEQRELRPGR